MAQAGEAALAAGRVSPALGSILAGAWGEAGRGAGERGDLKVRLGTEANTFTEILICNNTRT